VEEHQEEVHGILGDRLSPRNANRRPGPQHPKQRVRLAITHAPVKPP
jgi:hypothetical protein